MIRVLLGFYANFHSGLIEIAFCFIFITGCKNRIFFFIIPKEDKNVCIIYIQHFNQNLIQVVKFLVRIDEE